MKKVVIKNLVGQQTHGAEMLDPTAWLADGVANNWWGKPERWVPHKDEGGEYDEADVLEEKVVELSPAIAEVMDDSGAIVQEAIPAKLQKQVKLRAEYTVEVIDISAQVALENCMAARKAEYPTPEEFMNAFFDGDVEANLEALRQARLAVKAKYKKL
jgi:hypothetical protein